MNMDTAIIQQHGAELLSICKKLHNGACVIALVGSRCRDDFKKTSDIDIVIFSKVSDVFKHLKTLYINGKRVCITQRPIDACNVLFGYQLSWYDLETDVLHPGNGDIEFLKRWKKHGKRT